MALHKIGKIKGTKDKINPNGFSIGGSPLSTPPFKRGKQKSWPFGAPRFDSWSGRFLSIQII